MATNKIRHSERSEGPLYFAVAVACLSCAFIVCMTSARAQVVAQPQTAVSVSPQPTFDIVSIRPMRQDDQTPTHINNSYRHGSISAVNVDLKSLMEVAYDIPDLRIYGGEDWTTSQKYSLEAKADPRLDAQLASLTPKEAKQIKRNMLTALLSDQFKLRVHTQTRDLAIYALVVAKGGAKLEHAGIFAQSDAGDSIVITPGADSLEVLTYELSWRLGRPVEDRTGLAFKGGIRLSFQDDSAGLIDSGQPSIFTAIQEQLGLKLEPTKGPVPVLIIDHAERPTGN